ncbi:MAG: hypothetical protein BYD32DRAFT_472367 [Podila humilis]|nr:MAG: hypothetical protein BYD32DRAFT_472367 [Podila humilis]
MLHDKREAQALVKFGEALDALPRIDCLYLGGNFFVRGWELKVFLLTITGEPPTHKKTRATCGGGSTTSPSVITARPSPRSGGLIVGPDQFFARYFRYLQENVATSPVLHERSRRCCRPERGTMPRSWRNLPVWRRCDTPIPRRWRVPSLRSLELNEPWVLSNAVLERMAQQVFPNLRQVDLYGCGGFETAAWILTTTGMSFLDTAMPDRVLGRETGTCLDPHRRGTAIQGCAPAFETETRRRLRFQFSDVEYVYEVTACFDP